MGIERKLQADIAAGAIDAAVGTARRFQAVPIDPVVLHTSQHISIRLFPLDIVARVVSADDPEATSRLAREIEVARYLVGKSAPVVGPSTLLPAGPHIQHGFALTFWKFVEHGAADTDNPEHIARSAEALARVHNELAGYRGELPELWTKLDHCQDMMASESALPALRSVDRAFLRAAFDHLRASLKSLTLKAVPLHGDAHLGNAFITPGGAALWNDFDDVCLGPREWDIGSLPDTDVAAFEPVNRDLLAVMQCLRSACVSIWCWDQHDNPEKREAAEFHLERLRSSPLLERLPS
jgi:predicted trehalose synthase